LVGGGEGEGFVQHVQLGEEGLYLAGDGLLGGGVEVLAQQVHWGKFWGIFFWEFKII
jgi:hypothetical protein